ncbi:probable inactive 1-aminocyclopropane-1-carboxylate synthase-like protein 2 [Dysidea avara]|uniref:probable inactive 1-aminocyclopropane-1-carboxylate synthase-like protein 2 n=1 Tax=Dysidea avara TaxID=196820 RepID=UPI0033229D17
MAKPKLDSWYVSNRFALEKGAGMKPLFEAFLRYDSNPYITDSNPEGIISVAISHNGSVLDLIQERLSRPDCHQWSQQLVRYPSRYPEFYAVKFKAAVADFLTWKTKPVLPIEPSDVLIHNGTGTSLDCFCHAACDPGDYIMVPTPYYGGFHVDICFRSGAKIYPVDCTSDNNYMLTIKLLEDTLTKAKNEGCRVRALLITNPSNPVGLMFTREQIREMIQFCHSNQLHYISDEIYMNSVHSEDAEFVSVLNIDNVPDPNAVHLLWGFSKDFGMPGFQVGCLVTHCQPIKDLMRGRFSLLHQPASYVRQMLTTMISDREWLEKMYFPTCIKRLREQLEMTIDWLNKNGVPFIRPMGGLYIYANFNKFLSDSTCEAETALCDKFFDVGVYITPSVAFHGVEPGWFRIVFAEEPSCLKLALQRLQKALK